MQAGHGRTQSKPQLPTIRNSGTCKHDLAQLSLPINLAANLNRFLLRSTGLQEPNAATSRLASSRLILRPKAVLRPDRCRLGWAKAVSNIKALTLRVALHLSLHFKRFVTRRDNAKPEGHCNAQGEMPGLFHAPSLKALVIFTQMFPATKSWAFANASGSTTKASGVDGGFGLATNEAASDSSVGHRSETLVFPKPRLPNLLTGRHLRRLEAVNAEANRLICSTENGKSELWFYF